jgi:hypothetical protein
VLHDLAALDDVGVRFVEQVQVDTEAMLLALARRSAA